MSITSTVTHIPACKYPFNRNVGVIMINTRKIGRTLTKLVITFVVIIIVGLVGMSLSAKSAVRARMMIDGHPVAAVTCHPKYTKDGSQALGGNVYTISSKYAYKAGTTEVFHFRVNSFWLFHYASIANDTM